MQHTEIKTQHKSPQGACDPYDAIAVCTVPVCGLLAALSGCSAFPIALTRPHDKMGPLLNVGTRSLATHRNKKVVYGLAGLSVTCANEAELGPLTRSGKLKSTPCTVTLIVALSHTAFGKI